jgi:predicted metal-dependent peptidase
VPRHARSAAADRDGAAQHRYRGIDAVRRHPALSPMASQARLHEARAGNNCPPSGWAVVASDGTIHLNPDRSGTPGDWSWAIAHCLLHLGFGHLDEGGREERSGKGEGGFDLAWNLACCLTVNRFLEHLGSGLQLGLAAETTPYGQLAETSRGEVFLARRLRELGTDLNLSGVGVGGPDGDLLRTGPVMPVMPAVSPAVPLRNGWAELLAAGLARVAGDAVDTAGGASRRRKTAWRQALDWFMANYPLIGAIADAFTLIDDADVCHAHGVRVAAVSPAAAELYVNPLYPLTDGERRFVIAHELLHAGLRHDTRAEWRDPWLWNVACDYVINGWLVEMGVGESPDSALYDRALRGMSAEEVYDRIVTDRRLRKLATLRGVGLADVLPHPLPRGPADPVRGVDLDEFYRRSLADGLGHHQARGRGTLPAGLVEEIRTLARPPVPWDVQLASRSMPHR